MIHGAITRSAYLTTFRVRGSFVGPVVFLMVMFAVEGSFWTTLGRGDGVGEYSSRGIVLYCFLALIVSQIVTSVGDPDRLPEHIETGLLDQFLLRPKHFLVQMMSVQLGNSLARTTVFVPLAMGCDLALTGTLGLGRYTALLLLLPLAATLNFLINQVLYTLTFYFRESYAFVAAKETLFWVLSGALIPLDLFPEGTQSLIHAFPPAYVAYLPVKVALGDASFVEVLLGECFFVGVFWGLAAAVWEVGVRRYQAYGG